jgi:hypothetical protein
VNAKETARELARKWFKACDFEDADDEMLAEMVESALLARWDAAVEACAKIPEGIARKEGWQVNSEPAWACAETAAECRALKGQGGK